MQLDLTKPNTGRLIDYWLGGTHNFEIDRLLADQVARRFPLAKALTVEARQMVGRGVEYFHRYGIRAIIDFGSALPTCDNTHLIAHQLDPTIKVVYSDIDPITVTYGQDLLEGNPNAIYLQCDAAQSANLLNHPTMRKFLGDERRVGFIFYNLAHAMDDDQVRQSWQALYDWAAPGSLLFANNASENWNTDPDLIEVQGIFGTANLTGYYRDPKQLRALAHPWQVTSKGIVSHDAWLHPDAPRDRLYDYVMLLTK